MVKSYPCLRYNNKQKTKSKTMLELSCWKHEIVTITIGCPHFSTSLKYSWGPTPCRPWRPPRWWRSTPGSATHGPDKVCSGLVIGVVMVILYWLVHIWTFIYSSTFILCKQRPSAIWAEVADPMRSCLLAYTRMGTPTSFSSHNSSCAATNSKCRGR